MLDSKALTKVQSVLLIATIAIAGFGGSLAYVLWSGQTQVAENIRIGICADLDMSAGKAILQGATLAAEQINAAGGILKRNITIVTEDDDGETPPFDVTVAANAMTKLTTVDKADYIIAAAGTTPSIAYSVSDICAQQKKIMLTNVVAMDQFTQRVLDNYEKYKYIFRTTPPNASTISSGMLEGLTTLGKYTGFTKVALLFIDVLSARTTASYLNETLPSHGLQIVYSNFLSREATDFTSYFAAAEAAGAEIVVPYIPGGAGVSFVKEWHDRQSPTVVWGVLTGLGSSFWNLTEGKCDTVSFSDSPVTCGYPLTNETVPTREAYFQRWGAVPTMTAVGAYDTLRIILYDALKRAGTTDTEAVIKALENTNVETSSARHFVFTSSHDVMVGSGAVNNPAEDYMVVFMFQWQNGTQVPITPQTIMREAGATYKYPDWTGPWSKNKTP